MECAVAIRLLEAYTHALHVFQTVQEPVPAGTLVETPVTNRAPIGREEAYLALSRARGIYWKHVQMHGCRLELSRSNRKREIYASLQTDLLEARRRFDGASREYHMLCGVAQDSMGTSDGTYALNRARRIHGTAHEAYTSALQRFTDFVIRGVAPEDVPE
ncbi:MAG TPA: hypothetical protein VG096_00310 [Bryobacteraceae bacterium]|jgi:hypothetical protein|nr:hypothetical protein [Bryobacteraceae bacterium]